MWFGFLGGPVAWSVSELVPYMLIAHTCLPNIEPLARPNSPAAWPAAVGVTAAMLLVGLVALAVSGRDTMRMFADTAGYDLKAAESHHSTARRFLAFGGVLFSVIFTSLVVYNLIALLAESVCRVG
jgi:hypothetical protein